MSKPGVLEVAETEFLDVRILVCDPISSLDHLFIIGFVDLCE